MHKANDYILIFAVLQQIIQPYVSVSMCFRLILVAVTIMTINISLSSHSPIVISDCDTASYIIMKIILL